MRDQADYDFRSGENAKNRAAALINTALASDPSKYSAGIGDLKNLVAAISADVFGG